MNNQFPKCIAADIDGIHWQLLDSEGKQVQIGSIWRGMDGKNKGIKSGTRPSFYHPEGSVFDLLGRPYEADFFGFKWVGMYPFGVRERCSMIASFCDNWAWGAFSVCRKPPTFTMRARSFVRLPPIFLRFSVATFWWRF